MEYSDELKETHTMSVTYHYDKFPPIIDVDDELWSLTSQANAELGRYDGFLSAMENSDVLLSPLFTQEAVLSSKIEGTQSTLTEVLAYEASDGKQKISEEKRNDIKEILNYRLAMKEARQSLKKYPLSERILKKVHKELMEETRGKNASPGTYRQVQNWIGGDKQKNARFTPIKASDINNAMSNFSKYMHHDNTYDDLIKIAILHAEFEAIHPFLDGNGRVGRVLIPLYLWKKGLLATPSFYISAYFERKRDSYYDLLRQVSAKNDWLSWVKFFIEGIATQSKENLTRAKSIIDYYKNLKKQLPTLSKSAYGIAALDAIFKKTYFHSTYFYNESNIPRTVSQRLLRQFVKNGILICMPGHGRKPNFYFFEKLIDIADGKIQRL